MDIIAYKGRHISFLLMNMHIICTNALVGDHLVNYWILLHIKVGISPFC